MKEKFHLIGKVSTKDLPRVLTHNSGRGWQLVKILPIGSTGKFWDVLLKRPVEQDEQSAK
jgi:hypothetical protein